VTFSIGARALLLAAAQGLFLAATLAGTRLASGRNGNRLLVALLMVCVLILGDAWSSLQGFERKYPHLSHASIALPLLIGPLLYLYLGSILYDRPIGRPALRHFLPFGAGLLIWSPYYLQDAETKHQLLLGTNNIPLAISLFALPKTVSLFAYTWASVRLCRQARHERPGERLCRALALLTSGLGVGMVCIATLFAAEHFQLGLPLSSDTLGGLVLTGFIYALAVVAIRLPADYQPAAPAKPKYAGKALAPAQRAEYLDRLTLSMEKDLAYRDGDLKLDTLAARLAMTPHELSQLVNDACQSNFQDYLNRWRAQALASALRDEANAGSSILELALACGFNSKSAINRSFKKHLGVTPTEFRNTPPRP
jgi:AraC-like DNA-binding protein